nr:uncharacterized protein LOC129267725 [Lytechinus pictus]
MVLTNHRMFCSDAPPVLTYQEFKVAEERYAMKLEEDEEEEEDEVGESDPEMSLESFIEEDDDDEALHLSLILSSAKLVIEQRPHLNTISQPVLRREKPPTKLRTHLEVEESRDKSWNGCAQEVMARTTKEAGLGSLDGKKEGFRQRSKLLTVSC